MTTITTANVTPGGRLSIKFSDGQRLYTSRTRQWVLVTRWPEREVHNFATGVGTKTIPARAKVATTTDRPHRARSIWSDRPQRAESWLLHRAAGSADYTVLNYSPGRTS